MPAARRPGAGQAGFRLSFLSLPPRLPPSRDARNRWETTCIPFLSDIFVAPPRVNRSFQSRPLDVLVSLHFRKAALRTTVPSAVFCSEVFLLCAAPRACSANQRSRFMAEFIFGFYSRRREGGTANAWRGTDPPDYQSLVLTHYAFTR